MSRNRRFPIGFWNYTSLERHIINHDAESCVKDWADAGMTLATSPYFGADSDDVRRMQAILDAADKADIQVILSHNGANWANLTKNGEEVYRRDFSRAVDELGNHPAVFGFLVGDEPVRAQLADAYRAHCIQKELAPHLQPFMNLLPMDPGNAPTIGYEDRQGYFDEYVAAARCSLLCYDFYAQMCPGAEDDNMGYMGWEGYFDNLRIFQQAAQRHEIDYWTTLLSTGHYNYRCPNEDDLRWQLNTALASGVNGVLWFFFYMRAPHENYRLAPIDEHWQRTETYAWLSRVCQTFLKWQAPILLESKLVHACHVGRSWGGWPKFDGAGLVAAAHSSEGTPLIISRFKHTGGADYLAVVNNSQTRSTRAKLVVRGNHPNMHRVGWADQETPLVNATGSGAEHGTDYIKTFNWLAPGQMELFRLENPMIADANPCHSQNSHSQSKP